MIELVSLQSLFFELPLYQTVKLTENREFHVSLFGKSWPVPGAIVPASTTRYRPDKTIDGHCPYCHKETTFLIQPIHIPDGAPWDNVLSRFAFDQASLVCVRNDAHVLRYYFQVRELELTKVGQFPSLADIANDESRKYRKILGKENSTELHKAIGLAAHGVGIGSFVYLRRIFERLVQGRFDEWKSEEGWADEGFVTLRMQEKVDFLKDHLPEFIVAHSRLYSILSKGIHELTDEDCLAAFEPIKLSIMIILDEDEKKRTELEMRKLASDAIKKFTH